MRLHCEFAIFLAHLLMILETLFSITLILLLLRSKCICTTGISFSTVLYHILLYCLSILCSIFVLYFYVFCLSGE